MNKHLRLLFPSRAASNSDLPPHFEIAEQAGTRRWELPAVYAAINDHAMAKTEADRFAAILQLAYLGVRESTTSGSAAP